MAEISFDKPSGESVLIWLDATVNELHASSAAVTEHAVEKNSNIADHIRRDQDVFSIEFMISNTPIVVPKSHTEGSVEDGSPVLLFIDQPGHRRHGGDPITTNPGQPPRSTINAIGGLGVGVPGANVIRTPGIRPEMEGQPIEDFTPAVPDVHALHFTTTFDRVKSVYEELHRLIGTGTLIRVHTSLRDYDNLAIESLQAPREAGSGNAIMMALDVRQLKIVSSETVNVTVPVQTRARPARKLGAQPTHPVVEPKRQSMMYKGLGLTGGSSASGL